MDVIAKTRVVGDRVVTPVSVLGGLRLSPLQSTLWFTCLTQTE